jgi:hypothetical protein
MPCCHLSFVIVFVLLDGDRMDIGSRRRLALVIERRLCFQQVAGIFKDYASVNVARLVDVDPPHPGLFHVLLQIVGVRTRR